MIKELFGCREKYYKNLLELEEKKVKTYQEAYMNSQESYYSLMGIALKIINHVGDEDCHKKEILEYIEQATGVKPPDNLKEDK
jgi:hypothetical protein